MKMTNKEFLRELEELTDQARELIAHQAVACGMDGAKVYLDNFSALVSYHDQKGHITVESQAFRNKLTQELLDEIKFYFGEEAATKINACL